MTAKYIYSTIIVSLFICVATAQTLIAAPTVEKVKRHASKSSKATQQAAREKKFETLLSDAVLEGLWQMTGAGGLSSKFPLTTPKPERYTIVSATKIGTDDWLIQARVEIAKDKDVTIPVPVRVLWAGNTPVITLDEISIPMLGTYSARVMMQENLYSGVWWSYAKDYGGTMAGRIIKAAPSDAALMKNTK